MKKYLFSICLSVLSTLVMAQPASDWPAVETGGTTQSLFLNGIPLTNGLSGGDIIGVFAWDGTKQALVGQSTLTIQGTASFFNLINLGTNGITATTPISAITIYDVEGGQYYSLDLAGMTPANPPLQNFLTANNNNNTPAPSNATVPVELTSFEAVYAQNKVNLTWSTASEENNDFFAVEKSLDGKVFEVLGEVQGAGTTIEAQEYSYTDMNITAKTNYYRLKQVDFDGTFAYSDIVVVEATGSNLTTTNVKTYPNPVVNELNIQLPASTKAVTFTIMDLTGKVVLVDNRDEVTEETTTVEVGNLPSGTYMLQIENGGETTSKRIIIQK